MGWVRRIAAHTTLFYRILVASSAIVLVGAVAGTWITRALLDESPLQLIAGFVLAGVSLHVVANFWILRAAMKPLRSLQRTVDEVYSKGNLTARATREPMGDPDTNRLIDALNAMLERLESNRRELQRLPSKVLSAQEEERKRIARELHDETGQALTSVIVELKALERAKGRREMRERAARLRVAVAETLEAVHRMAVELRPSALDELGLLPALRSYGREYERKFGIKVDFQAADLKSRLPAEVEVAVYRVVQEALTNAARHSGASRVTVQLGMDGPGLVAMVRDNGRGFDVGRAQRFGNGGLGLFGVKERISLLSGQLEIESSPGAGTTIVARVPLSTMSEEAPS